MNSNERDYNTNPSKKQGKHGKCFSIDLDEYGEPADFSWVKPSNEKKLRSICHAKLNLKCYCGNNIVCCNTVQEGSECKKCYLQKRIKYTLGDTNINLLPWNFKVRLHDDDYSDIYKKRDLINISRSCGVCLKCNPPEYPDMKLVFYRNRRTNFKMLIYVPNETPVSF